jgi:cellulose synthase/poly-beta-1,6-N-acetylglucosamine synthase-like glycosyltransferase
MLSIIISYYKNMPALRLIFDALAVQTYGRFEAIVAEDAQDAAAIAFIAECRRRYPFPILHVSHEDCGFRKTKILNDAIRISHGEGLVFIDGDCIPHRRFMEVYARSILAQASASERKRAQANILLWQKSIFKPEYIPRIA